MVQRQKAAREQRRVQELERIRLRRVAEEARQRDEAEAQRRREELAREQQRLAALAQIQAEAVVLLQVRGPVGTTCCMTCGVTGSIDQIKKKRLV